MAKKTRSFAYQYLQGGTGGPLTHCPACGHDLTAPGQVCLLLSVAGREVVTSSQLDADGRLADTDDGAVAAGYHSGTECGNCGKLLLSLADVTEVQEVS